MNIMSKGSLAEETSFTGETPVIDDPFFAVGQFLAQSREELGLSVKDIARITNIRYLYLEAIERGDLNSLPGRVYTIGFVKSYANALNIDGNELVLQANLLSHIPEYNISAIPTPLPDQDLPSGRILIVSGLLVIGLIVAAYLWHRSPNLAIYDPATQPPSTTEPTALVPAKIEQEALPAEAIEANPVFATPTAPQALLAEKKAGQPLDKSLFPITVKAKTTSWVEIMDVDNKKIVSKLLTAGEVIKVPEQEGMTLSTGNAGGIEVSVNGKVIPTLGPIGHLKKGIKLDESLLELSEKAPG
jgi:cytoskeleton protein RodZ